MQEDARRQFAVVRTHSSNAQSQRLGIIFLMQRHTDTKHIVLHLWATYGPLDAVAFGREERNH